MVIQKIDKNVGILGFDLYEKSVSLGNGKLVNMGSERKIGKKSDN